MSSGPRQMPSLIRVATSVCAAVSAAALSFHLTNKPAQTEQKRPLQNRANHDASETRPAFSEGFVGMVGNTPLVRIKSLSDATGCNIFGKAEYMNPSGSVKDRAAVNMVDLAMRSELIKRGDVVCEATGGNTGVSLALVSASQGFRTILCMTAGVSKEKQDLMRLYGAEIVLCPPGPVRRDGVINPTNYRVTAERIAHEKGGVYTNQFDNVANFLAHYNGTGPEIFRQTQGKLDAFVCASGTGGTISGVSNFLKDTNPDIKVFLADCDGSALASKVLTGKLEMFGSGSFAEGIGNSMITGNHGRAIIDDAVRVSDQELLEMGYFLLRNDALFVGPAAALNACAAVKVARKLGPGHNIVTILCDGGDRYISKMYNKEWLEGRNLAVKHSGVDLSFIH